MASECTVYAPFFGFAGITFAMVFSALGAAYGTATAGSAVAAVGTLQPHLIMTALLPIIMSGILSIYGMIISVFIATSIAPTETYSMFSASLDWGAGASIGLCALAAGGALGAVGEAGVRGYAKQPRLFFGWMLMLIFAEVIALYGVVSAVLMHSAAGAGKC